MSDTTESHRAWGPVGRQSQSVFEVSRNRGRGQEDGSTNAPVARNPRA